ncbi:MAG: hypothetical protein OQK94_01225 [Gammaproteobacteria bacterium]|nr:hypothetical protein [Gammaproteobacteria bacterium]MCW8841714.1 hypothetical protein [Gammaproteobacteria bacterium]MCW8927290.1 hypothetical protein [Gammaproteobacteria bacterium]MCW8959622.1 hypothetical protein [Gammaproteobacteria bacterium]MCW8973910.1 hypothetical protein [Gammaproteobacteria bacterium]
MSQSLIEKHEPVIIEMANIYLDNMELALARKYKNNDYQVNAAISNAQYDTLKAKHNIPNREFADLYQEFQKMKPTTHLRRVMSAFTASGGSVEVEPYYDEDAERLKVSVNFVIDDKALDKIEGLSPIEDLLLKMDAMLQIDTVLSGADPEISPSF